MTQRKFAENTSVPPEKSRMEIEMAVKRYGAEQFYSGWDEMAKSAVIGFRMENRIVQFKLRIPPPLEEFDGSVKLSYGNHRRRTRDEMKKAQEQEERRRWRCLHLAIKAKLEAVATKIASFDAEFLAHVVLPDGSTVGEWVGPQLDEVYSGRKMPAMLPALGETGGGT